jgi:hypothetical protein
MNFLALTLANCYGIKSFTYTFDFTAKPVYAIYAPNGVMKTSFAKTMMDYSKERDSKDEIYPERITVRKVQDEIGNEISSDKIFVIEPYNQSYRSAKVSTLLVNNELRQEYEAILEGIEKSLDNLLQPLRKLSGIRKEIAPIISKDITGSSSDIYIALRRIRDEVNADMSGKWNHIKYDSIFTPRVDELLKVGSFIEDLLQYTEVYESLIEKSVYFKKGIFNHNNADTVAKNLSDNGFFTASHTINLFKEDGYTSVRTLDELKSIIQDEKNKIIEDDDLKKAFEKLDKQLRANQELRDFREYLTANLDILPELRNIQVFKQKMWISYIKDNVDVFNELMASYETGKSRIDEIVAAAKEESTKWARVVNLFNSRFNVPFKLIIQNQEDVILKKEGPNVAFVFSDGIEPRPVEENTLLKVLSNGERRALYLLNTIFEIEARISNSSETFFIIDDIADSFDYKNKYAIIEYLKDISNISHFRQLIFTHNFDFFRTISSRLDMGRANKLHCRKSPTEVALVEEKYQNNPFNHWKNNLSNDRSMLIASIPFIRNIAEFTGDEANFQALTSLLHIKNDSKTITFLNLQSFHRSILKDQSGVIFDDPNESVIDKIYEEADIIQSTINVDVDLEKKIVLAIAIRLKCEEYLIGRINDSVFCNAISRNQTFVLCKRFKEDFPGESEIAALLDQINLMTPENIHLNSFMYEPILDLSNTHLKSLYQKAKDL